VDFILQLIHANGIVGNIKVGLCQIHPSITTESAVPLPDEQKGYRTEEKPSPITTYGSFWWNLAQRKVRK